MTGEEESILNQFKGIKSKVDSMSFEETKALLKSWSEWVDHIEFNPDLTEQALHHRRLKGCIASLRSRADYWDDKYKACGITREPKEIKPRTSISVMEFIKDSRNKLESFKAMWLRNHKIEPSEFPLNFELGFAGHLEELLFDYVDPNEGS